MRGSITIFATMLLMLVSQFLFTVLEAGRNLTLTNIACMNSEAVAESVFAQYCRPLWDEYHLLAYDAGSDAMGNVDIENVKSYMKQLTIDNFKIRRQCNRKSAGQGAESKGIRHIIAGG